MYPTDFNRFRSGVSVSQALADWQPVAAQVFTLFSVRSPLRARPPRAFAQWSLTH